MPWYNKETITPFDNQPIEGLFYLNGDVIARMKRAAYAEGMKYPGIAFPSGKTCELWGTEYTLVHLFDALDLPLFETRDEAYVTSNEWNEEGYYSTFKRGDNQLELWDHETETVYVITYHEELGQIVDVDVLR